MSRFPVCFSIFHGVGQLNTHISSSWSSHLTYFWSMTSSGYKGSWKFIRISLSWLREMGMRGKPCCQLPMNLDMWAEAAGSCAGPLATMRTIETPTQSPGFVSHNIQISCYMRDIITSCLNNYQSDSCLFRVQYFLNGYNYWRYLWIRGKVSREDHRAK